MGGGGGGAMPPGGGGGGAEGPPCDPPNCAFILFTSVRSFRLPPAAVKAMTEPAVATPQPMSVSHAPMPRPGETNESVRQRFNVGKEMVIAA